ncbi:MAG: hypothetical protein JXA68_02050 [Ignavibacteriales bacterium]|nr:hypothetical protein [Ignavibacteriales bacterium]
MFQKSDPWYIHLILYVVIVVLIYLLVKVAIVDPTETLEKENFFRTESRLRMENIRELQIRWEKKNEAYTDDLAKLIEFFKTDKDVQKLLTAVDTLGVVEVEKKDANGNVIAKYDSVVLKPLNPFRDLSHGTFDPDCLMCSPKTHTQYILKIDTSTEYDTVIDRNGRVIKVDSTVASGKRYLLECPDGYGKIGDIMQDALKNAASWE